MVSSVCWYGHVFGNEDGHVLRRACAAVECCSVRLCCGCIAIITVEYNG